MVITFEKKMALFAKKNGLTVKWQNMNFGYRRAVFACDSNEELEAIWSLLRKMKGVAVDTWTCFEVEFEGYVYAMDATAKKELREKEAKRLAEVENWWLRYRAADDETKRLMACGAIQ